MFVDDKLMKDYTDHEKETAKSRYQNAFFASVQGTGMVFMKQKVKDIFLNGYNKKIMISQIMISKFVLIITPVLNILWGQGAGELEGGRVEGLPTEQLWCWWGTQAVPQVQAWLVHILEKKGKQHLPFAVRTERGPVGSSSTPCYPRTDYSRAGGGQPGRC
jgi:hypothetical protein